MRDRGEREKEFPRARKENTVNLLTKWNPLRATQWDPFKELENFERGLESFFGRTPSLRGNGGEAESVALTEWSPVVDITEDEKEYLVKAELPEVKKEDVKVTVENGVLEIRGERKFEKEEKGKKYHRIERSYGSFQRMFSLPEGVEGDQVKAQFKDGLLTVHLPKSEKAKAKVSEIAIE